MSQKSLKLSFVNFLRRQQEPSFTRCRKANSNSFVLSTIEKAVLINNLRKSNKLSLSSSKNYSNELQKVFDYFDEDGNGKISPSELQSCVRTVGGELSMDEAEAAVRASDLNGDGLLDFEEFQKLMDAGGEEDKNEELKEAFGMYEMEGSGCITPTSLKRMLSRLGESKSIEDCKAMIRMFDLNGDGVLSFDEFQSMMR
nr:calcium-binding protein cml37 [Quercus suber]